MPRTQPLPAPDEQRPEHAPEDQPPVSAAVVERRRRFAQAAWEIAAQTPRPWDLDGVALLREDRER